MSNRVYCSAGFQLEPTLTGVMMFSVDGTYTYSANTLIMNPNLTLEAVWESNTLNTILDTSSPFSSFGCGTAFMGTTPYSTCPLMPSSGTVQSTVQSAPFTITAGQSYTLFDEFDMELACLSVNGYFSAGGLATCTADFGDPVLTNIELTDANGVPVSGASLVGADGTIYPVNVNNVPEPAFTWLLADALAGIAWKRFAVDLRP